MRLWEVRLVTEGGQRGVTIHGFLMRRDQVGENSGGDGVKPVYLNGL